MVLLGHPLRGRKPWTPTEAEQFINIRYPKDGQATVLAAEALGRR